MIGAPQHDRPLDNGLRLDAGCRQGDVSLCASAELADEPDLATISFDDQPGIYEAKTDAVMVPVEALLDLRKRPEELAKAV